MANQFGERIRLLREHNNLLQRQVAAVLEIDSPMLSKLERGERKAKKEQVLVFAKLYKVKKEELLTLWLADQVVEVVEHQEYALSAMQLAEEEVKYYSSRKK